MVKYFFSFLFLLFFISASGQLTQEEIDCLVDNYNNPEAVCVIPDTVMLQPKVIYAIPISEEDLLDQETFSNYIMASVNQAIQRYEISYPQYNEIIFKPNNRYVNKSVYEGIPYSYTYTYIIASNKYRFFFAFEGYGIE